MKSSSKINASNLLQAMQVQDIDNIKQILSKDIDLKVKIDDVTLLTYAVMIGNLEIISLLIEAGANINQRSGNSLTPLAHAAAYGAFDEFMCIATAGAKLNLTYKININSDETLNNPLLLLAVVGGSVEICDYILKNKGDLELTNDSGISPLLASLYWDKLNIFDYLLSAGAHPDPSCSAKGIAALSWMSPLIVAAGKGSATAVKALLSRGANVNRTAALGTNALKLAVISGDRETVIELLNAGSIVDIVDMEGWTPLMNAATEGNVIMASLLLMRGANPNHSAVPKLHSKDDGRTALMNAAFNGHVAIIRALLKAGANINTETPLGASALSYAIQARVRSSELLTLTSNLPKSFESKGDAQEFSDDLGKRSLEVIRVLIANGADINCRVDGVVATTYIDKLEDPELMRHFEKLIASINKTSTHDSTDVLERVEFQNEPAVKSQWEIIKSKDTRSQVSAASLLMHEITFELNSIKSSQYAGKLENLDALILAIGLSQESFDPIFEMREIDYDLKDNWTYADRTSSMISGPFYTSNKYTRDKSWMPIVQIDLCELTGLKNMNFGKGLLQLWYPIGADPSDTSNAIIVFIPKSEISQDLLTPWKFFYDPEPCEINISPVPPEWGAFFWIMEGCTHIIKGVVSRGIRCPDGCIEAKLKLIESTISKDLNLKIRKFVDICKFTRPLSPKGEMIELGLFGTFQFDKDELQPYDAIDIGLMCLINIVGWDETGQAQLFYQLSDDGSITYKFRDYWEKPGYDTTRDRELYMGRR